MEGMLKVSKVSKKIIFLGLAMFILLLFSRSLYTCPIGQSKQTKTLDVTPLQSFAINTVLYNNKYHNQQPVYIDQHFGSASGGSKIHQFRN